MHAGVKKELTLAAALLGFGVLLLPYAIYLVGQQVVGEYEGDGGPVGLGVAIWTALVQGQWAAWLLVLSPYLVIQLLRLGAKIRRARKDVTPLTN
jgi:hypothetical protein